jgi:DNA-directed RNA polymerase specialized sigma subunit
MGGGPDMGGDPMGGPMDDPTGGQMDMNQDDSMGGDEPQDMNNGGVGDDIRQYAGELSQALNDYNEENPNDEGKLNKYAINMIAAQVADSLSDKDKRSVIKKLKGNADDMSDDTVPNEQPNDQQMELGESIVSEIVNELGKERKGKRHPKKISNKDVTRRNPFVWR